MPGLLSPGVNQQAHEFGHSPLSSSDIKNEQDNASTPSYVPSWHVHGQFLSSLESAIHWHNPPFCHATENVLFTDQDLNGQYLQWPSVQC
jgi:hypothetical protein